MGVKSIIDVDVNDEAFKKFVDLFGDYQKELHRSSEDWSRTDEGTKKIRKTFAQMVKDLTESKKQAAQTRSLAKDASSYWERLSSDSRKFASNIRDATSSLLKWTSLTSVFSGLLGIGGLFGLDRLASAVGAGRRSSLGLGLSYGEEKAFGVNYGRVVDAAGVLGGVNEALRDATKRYSLYGAGLTEGDLRGRDTAQVAAALLPKLKDIADRTPDALLGQVISARGLGQFVSIEDMLRLKNTPRQELSEYQAGYLRDRRTLGLDPRGQKIWQDFAVQMSRAGSQIENVFVRGLQPLIPGLGQLSSSVVKAIDTLLVAAQKRHWLEAFGAAIENAAKYVASDKFQQDIKDFVSGVEALAHGVRNALEALGIVPPQKGQGPAGVQQSGSPYFWDRIRDRLRANGLNVPGGYYGDANVGNLREVGKQTGFRHFGNVAQGVVGLANDLLYKENVRGLWNIKQIISRYAPPGENDTAAYIRDVAKTTGFGPEQYINLNDRTTLARLMHAIVKHEKGGKTANKLSEKVIIEILNNTGGSAIVSSSQIAK